MFYLLVAMETFPQSWSSHVVGRFFTLCPCAQLGMDTIKKCYMLFCSIQKPALVLGFGLLSPDPSMLF